ncbi:MAG: hypothetical protein NC328_01705 [Muribaculum sp.]|nr:hypothetical protein [Muribaculum sp.]
MISDKTTNKPKTEEITNGSCEYSIKAMIEADAVEQYPYHSPTPRQFPIIALNPYNYNDSLTDENIAQRLRDVSDCGFNTVIYSLGKGSREFSEITRLLNAIENANLNLNVITGWSDMSETSSLDVTILRNSFNSRRHLGGWLFQSGLTMEMLNDLLPQYKNFLQGTDDGISHSIYMDISNNMANNTMGICQTSSYPSNEKYEKMTEDEKLDYRMKGFIIHVQSDYKPSIWASFFNPILRKNGVVKVDYERYYDILKLMSDRAISTRSVFYGYCNSYYNTIELSGSWSTPFPTIPFLRFQAFSALAYGAQAIVYDRYAPVYSGQISVTGANGLVNSKSVKTAAWYNAQLVNSEILNLATVFLGAEVVEIRHTGADPYFKSTNNNVFQRMGALENIQSEDSGILISFLRNKFHNYLVIVNHDVINSQNISLDLIKQMNVSLIWPLQNNPLNVTETTKLLNRVVCTIEAGGVMIFTWID